MFLNWAVFKALLNKGEGVAGGVCGIITAVTGHSWTRPELCHRTFLWSDATTHECTFTCSD